MADTRAALDHAIRAYVEAEEALDAGEVVTTWLVIAATRTAEDGGAVIAITPGPAMPTWEAKGLLVETLDILSAATRGGDDD